MGLIKEFKEFAIKGNMLDMAVGIIIGAAFGTVVTSLVENVMMPLIGYVTGGINFDDYKITMGEGEKAFDWEIGKFFTALVSFFFIALAVFMIVKAANTARAHMLAEPESEEEAPPPEDILLLRDIRDALNGPSRAGE